MKTDLFERQPWRLLSGADAVNSAGTGMTAAEYGRERQAALAAHMERQNLEAAATARWDLVQRIKGFQYKCDRLRSRIADLDADGKHAMARTLRDGELLYYETKIDSAVSQLQHMTSDKRQLKQHLAEAGIK